MAAVRKVRHPEATEETLHRRALLKRHIIVAAVLGHLLVDVDLDRDNRGLHPLDNVGKADRLLELADLAVDRLGPSDAGKQVRPSARGPKTVNGDAEAGRDRGHQRKFPGRRQWAALGRERRAKCHTVLQSLTSKGSRKGSCATDGIRPTNKKNGDERLTARWRRS